jgi:23S rRNA-intervening sequence protein
MAGNVRDLKVFQRAYRLSLVLHRASLSWPRVEQYGGVADQLRRSSKSVCALMVEGPAVSQVRTPSSAAIFRWRWAQPTKRGCGVTMRPIWNTCCATRRSPGRTNYPRLPGCCMAYATVCLKTDD